MGVRLMSNPKEEAELIIDALFDSFGTGGQTDRDIPCVDGREAIQEMKIAGFPGWQEVEWAGYHIKFLVQNACIDNLSDRIRPYTEGKRHLVKGNFLWDTRLRATDVRLIHLGDVDEYNEIIRKNNGIGILFVDVYSHKDENGDFRRWHEEFKGGPSLYTIEREIEGRHVRKRKIDYSILKIFAFFFTNHDLIKGLKEGWLTDTFQGTMRNQDGTPRNTKYSIDIDFVPKEHLLLVRNFNEYPEEFDEDFPEFA